MPRFLKIAAYVVAAVVLLVVLAYTALSFYLTDERLRPLVEPPLEETLNREVSIGEIDLGFFRAFPNLVVGLQGLRVHTPDGPEGPRPDLAALERLRVVVEPLALLRRTLSIEALELVEPQILVEVYADSTSNLDSLMVAEESEAPADTAQALGEIDLERVEITDGQLGYTSADGTVFVVGDLDALFSARLAETYTVDGTVEAAGVQAEMGGVTYADGWSLAADLVAEADLENERLQLDESSVTVEDLTLAFEGSVSDWAQEALQVDLAFRTPEEQVRGFWSLLPETFTKDLDGLVAEGQFQLEGTVEGTLSETEVPALAATLALENGRIQYPDVPAPIEDLQVQARVTNDRFTLERFHAAAAGNTLTAEAVVREFTAPVFEVGIEAAVDLGSVERFYPLEPDETLAGRLDADVRLSGEAENPAAATGTGTVVLEEIAYASPALAQPVRDLSGRMTLDETTLRIDELALLLGRSDVRFEGAVERFAAFAADSAEAGPKPFVSGQLTSRYFNASEQLSEDTTEVEDPEPLEPPDLGLDVAVAIDSLIYADLPLTDATGRLVLEDGVFRFEEGRAQAFDGVLEASGAFDLSNPERPALATALNMQEVAAQAVFTELESFNRYAGLGQFLTGTLNLRMDANVTMDGQLEPDLRTARAEGAFSLLGGALEGLPLQERLAELTGVQALSEAAVTRWGHRFRVAGEQLFVQDLDLDAGDFNLALSGTQDLGGQIDYAFTLSLPPGAEDQLRSAPISQALGPVTRVAEASLVDPETNRIVLDFAAEGTFQEPAIRLNTELVQQRLEARVSELARREVEERTRRLAEEQESRLGDAVRDALGVPSDTSKAEGAASGADSLGKEVRNELESRLKGLFGRKKNNDDS